MSQVTKATSMKRRVTQFLLVVIMALGIFAVVGFTSPSGASAATSTVTTTSASYEVNFMEQMINHHNMAKKMAQICLQKATHDQLRTMCQNIISSQIQEIATMQSWLAKWYGIQNYQPQMTSSDKKQLAYLSSLKDGMFEMAFMNAMILHHQIAINRSETCLVRATHKPLIDLCQTMISSQTTEVHEMQTWLCQWYKICLRQQ